MNFVGFAAFVCVLVLPSTVWAQQASGIAGVVRHTSGAVLPGVTVEAASPALIEKVHTVVTDGEGRYNVVDLRPGTHSVTFTLTGFSTSSVKSSSKFAKKYSLPASQTYAYDAGARRDASRYASADSRSRSDLLRNAAYSAQL
jgi:hypothetical protein